MTKIYDFAEEKLIGALRAVLVPVKHRQMTIDDGIRHLLALLEHREDAIIEVVKLAVVELEREVAFLKRGGER